MAKPLAIMVLCGGQSTEHDISILSARYVLETLDPKKYTASVGYVARDGRWLFVENAQDFLTHDLPSLIESDLSDWIHLTPGETSSFIPANKSDHKISIDCMFPVFHGVNGEDGVMQGLLDALDVPYVGAHVLSSAICMDKDIAKRLLEHAGLPVVDWYLAKRADVAKLTYADLHDQLGGKLFVKPNSLGSSVGISKASDETSFKKALAHAFEFDDRVLIEKAMTGREIECSVLGNDKVIASLPGEIINHTDFYSYAAKYLMENGASVETPADLPPKMVTQVQALAKLAFSALRCTGMARVDFFLSNDNTICINEVNTIPGFTDISMYPKNWAASGLEGSELLDKLIQLGLSRHADKQSLSRAYQYKDTNITVNTARIEKGLE